MVRVKICGITSLRDAWGALDAGADALGFNFHHASPRRVSPGEARSIIRTLPPLAATFGVFADETPRVMTAIAKACGCGFIQAPADELWDPRLVPVVRVRSARDIARAGKLGARLLHLDSHHPRLAGGTGRSFRWSLLRSARPVAPFLLAGGLTPRNVREAVRTARPYGVDVCTGVERAPGEKDHAKLKAFVRAAKGA